MFANPSLITRIAIGKAIGLIVGIIAFFMMPALWPGADLLLRWGVLLWYVSLGAVIGVFGVIARHPVLRLPMPWWFRAPLVGAWMNFVLTFFAHDKMQALLTSVFGPGGVQTSPYWFVLEGALFGVIVGFFATRFGGEGAEAAGR